LGVCQRRLHTFCWPRESIRPASSWKAFGSVKGVRCWRPPVTGRQITGFLLRNLCPCRRNYSATVHRGRWTSTKLCVLLFVVYNLHELHRWVAVDGVVTIGSVRINRLLFADDLVLLASSEEALQRTFNRRSLSTADCPPSKRMVGCSIPGHRVNRRSAPWATAFTATTPTKSIIQAPACRRQLSLNKSVALHAINKNKTRRLMCAALCELYRSAVTKRELSNTAKLSVFKPVFVPIIIHGHDESLGKDWKSTTPSASGGDRVFAKFTVWRIYVFCTNPLLYSLFLDC